MNAQSLIASDVPRNEIAELEQFQTTLSSTSSLRHALAKITTELKDGADLVVSREDESITPNAAAKLLGISRTHLLKILDSGALPFQVVGERDRRIFVEDLRGYSDRLTAARIQHAHDLAHRDEIEAQLLDLMD